MGQTYQSITINSPIEKVWETVKDFHDMSWAPNVVSKLEKVGDFSGNQIGSKRVLNEAFHETLHELDEENYSIKYSIDEGPSPISSSEISNYFGNLKLTPVSLEDSTFIEWSSKWENNDEPAFEFCHGIYVALLNDMKKSLS